MPPRQTTQTTAPANDQALQDELNNRAEAFSKQFATATYEMGQAQNFIRELCTSMCVKGGCLSAWTGHFPEI